MDINSTIIWQTVFFGVFVWFCMKYVWPPMITALRDRQQKLTEGLQKAEEGEKKLLMAEEAKASLISEGKLEAQTHINQARQRAEKIVEEAKKDAENEKERIKSEAEEEISLLWTKARETLAEQVSELVILGSERIIESSVSKEQHAKLLQDLGSKL